MLVRQYFSRFLSLFLFGCFQRDGKIKAKDGAGSYAADPAHCPLHLVANNSHHLLSWKNFADDPLAGRVIWKLPPTMLGAVPIALQLAPAPSTGLEYSVK